MCDKKNDPREKTPSATACAMSPKRSDNPDPTPWCARQVQGTPWSMAKKKPTETELMKQYRSIKDKYPEGILFFRLGDFYEMFLDDAVKASQLLDIALTSRNKNADEPIPMAGVPHHSARAYIAKLTEFGEKVVLCEQVEDAKLVRGKRPVKREVVRVITPGVVLDDEVLDPKRPRYVAALACTASETLIGLAYLDVSTGEFHATELSSPDQLATELARVRPRELLSANDDRQRLNLSAIAPGTVLSTIEQQTYGQAKELIERALAGELATLGLGDRPFAVRAAADVIAYARATQPGGTLPVSRVHVYQPGDTVVLDETAIANLELTETLMERKKAGSLLSVIDRTKTAPGGRMIRRWLLYPLTSVAPIRRRQDAVDFLIERASLRRDVRDELQHIHDLERLIARVQLGVTTPRDLGRVRDSLERLPGLVALVQGRPGQPQGQPTTIEVPPLLTAKPSLLDGLAELSRLLAAALVDSPTGLPKDGDYIRTGYCEIVDEQRRLAKGGKAEVDAVQAAERERTGIANLKISHNRVFGYYIEVKKTHASRVPEDYIRKQTIATAERYVTTELSDLEDRILGAQDALLSREQALFDALCAEVGAHAELIRTAGAFVARVDTCSALADVAHTFAYVRPTVDDSEIIDIVDGRHPVVERMVDHGAFVPNDCRLDTSARQILLITGPNMAGKSTYMRQIAHIVLLAQMGSFVPAQQAHIGVCDQIFTRVGAADNLARGESTFMVEMREAAAILAGATRRSLVVLDEVGRGTSTFDGVSIAWAVTEFLHDAIGARTVFATHYHELCMLADTRPRVTNVSVAVREHNGQIVFLRQIVPGGSNRSYGIDVARLAGLPRSVISRAKHILGQLEGAASLGHTNQLSLFSAVQSAPPPPEDDESNEIIERLQALDPNRMTPLEALSALAELCQKV